MAWFLNGTAPVPGRRSGYAGGMSERDPHHDLNNPVVEPDETE
jgi:hypothetical protein